MHAGKREGFISSLLSFSLSFGRTKEAREGRRRGADFAVDVAPQSRSNLRLLPLHREEAGRAWIFAVLDVAPVLVAVEERRISTRLDSLDSGLREESTKSLLARFQRGVSSTPGFGGCRSTSRWCRSCEGVLLPELATKWAPSGLTVGRFAVLASDCAEGTLFVVFRLVRVVTGLRLELESLFELDRDTLHTRLGSSHECHSGGGRGAFALVSLRLVGLAIHGLVSVEVAIQSQLSRDGCVHSPRDGLVRVVTGLRLELESLFELDRDTLHTRLGSSHECHSGGGRGAFALVSLRLVGLAIHGLVSVEVAIQSQLSRDGCVHSPRDGYVYSPNWIGSDLTFPTVG
uniref:Uncharacterized protein n=1 Tax=Ananas comosus var. bracteatus TaxID=296719 RepID=A0A6V7P612_ANACO|nr:unnamed protein product [Ananas comosus var. bracteatus]